MQNPLWSVPAYVKCQQAIVLAVLPRMFGDKLFQDMNSNRKFSTANAAKRLQRRISGMNKWWSKGPKQWTEWQLIKQ